MELQAFAGRPRFDDGIEAICGPAAPSKRRFDFLGAVAEFQAMGLCKKLLDRRVVTFQETPTEIVWQL